MGKDYMSQSRGDLDEHQDLMTFADVVALLWHAKFFLFSFVVVCTCLAFAFISAAVPHYRAHIIIGPASHMGQGTAAASMIGEGTISVRAEELQSTAAFVRFEAIYDGVSVASLLVKDHKILEGLNADDAFRFSGKKRLFSPEVLSDYLQRRVFLEPVAGTALRHLSYLHPDPAFAVYLVSRLHSLTDEIIRARILVETQERMRYLNNALASTQNPEHRRSLVTLLMEQERLKMMVSLDQPYAASVIEPAAASAKPRWPEPYVVYPVAVFIGFLLGFSTFLLFRRRE